MKLRPFSHLIFDLDGVLLDTEQLYVDAISALLSELGHRCSEQQLLAMKGQAPEKNAADLIAHFALPLDVPSFLARRQSLLEQLLPTAAPIPGAEALVRGLAARAVPLAIATTSAARSVELKTRHVSWLSLIGTLVAGDDPQVGQRKPAPDVYLVAAARLGAEPARCLVIDDSAPGVEAGLSAGMQVIALPAADDDHAVFERAHARLSALDRLPLSLLLAAFSGSASAP